MMKPKTTEMARGKWHGILEQLGINRSFLVNRLGPCPLCGGKDRFRFDDKGGNGTYYCNGCGPGNGMKLAMGWTGLDFAECAARIDELCGSTKAETTSSTTDADRAAKTLRRLKEIGTKLQPVGDLDPVGRYLRRRGIKHLPKAHLRFHPALEYYDQGFKGTHPAMVAAFRRTTGEIETFHVTYLTSDGRKAEVSAPKKVTGVRQGLTGCAIRLSEVVEHIGIAEGIETALSVTELYGIPCWSCANAHGIETFQPPEGVREITVFADVDRNYTGQAAALIASRDLSRKGYIVHEPVFAQLDKDHNDLLLEAVCQA